MLTVQPQVERGAGVVAGPRGPSVTGPRGPPAEWNGRAGSAEQRGGFLQRATPGVAPGVPAAEAKTPADRCGLDLPILSVGQQQRDVAHRSLMLVSGGRCHRWMLCEVFSGLNKPTLACQVPAVNTVECSA